MDTATCEHPRQKFSDLSEAPADGDFTMPCADPDCPAGVIPHRTWINSDQAAQMAGNGPVGRARVDNGVWQWVRIPAIRQTSAADSAGSPATRAPYQQRVIDERGDLSEKLERLNAFRSMPTFAALPIAEQGLLAEQATHMLGYRDVLDARIRRWDGTADEVGASRAARLPL